MIVAQEVDEWGQVCEVRRAGGSLRLYTNGIFHSQFHSQKLLEGSLWDLLWLPCLAKHASSIKRVLVLGVGGGAVIRKLNQLYPSALIIGIDISRAHLRLAQRYFGVRGARMSLYEADAVAFMRYYRGPKFDVIIDDLFVGDAGEPRRVQPMTPHWCATLRQRLEPDGLLLANFASRSAYQQSLKRLKAGFASGYGLQMSQYENVFGAFYSTAIGDLANTLEARLCVYNTKLDSRLDITRAF
ncbi:spermidine synthase [Gilvimarinus chinensis]|uniref:spermidine synthase n=1 Tax=Gilvimarinus chinensis TaxID=396005 RepID=UPI00036AC6A7|nr:methyltransferase domain-containing protein [Gilvimarinus chinensis]